MTDKHIITDGCEFQSDCIEYKDISYLKIMPICVIHELSIACHDKVNKCKYYKLYKQLKAKEQECEDLKEKQKELLHDCNSCKFHQYKQAELKLKEIKEIVVPIKENTCFGMHCGAINWILKIIDGTTDINNIVSDTVHIQKIGDVTVKGGE